MKSCLEGSENGDGITDWEEELEEEAGTHKAKWEWGEDGQQLPFDYDEAVAAQDEQELEGLDDSLDVYR